jgi:hypothetical protein
VTDLVRTLLTRRPYVGEGTLLDCLELAEWLGLRIADGVVPEITTAEMIAKLLELARWVREAKQHGQEPGLTTEEVERIERESYVHAREDMARHRVVDLIANCSLDLKWINDGLKRVGDALEPDYRTQLETTIAQLSDFVNRARADWKSVDANAMAKAKDTLDRLSVRLHEIAIAQSLRGAAVDRPGT